jgi:hypothetical protein
MKAQSPRAGQRLSSYTWSDEWQRISDEAQARAEAEANRPYSGQWDADDARGTYYCNIGGSMRDTLHVDDIRTGHPSYANHEARSAEDIERIIAETGATKISFNVIGFPRGPVALTHPKLNSYLSKLFRKSPTAEPGG